MTIKELENLCMTYGLDYHPNMIVKDNDELLLNPQEWYWLYNGHYKLRVRRNELFMMGRDNNLVSHRIPQIVKMWNESSEKMINKLKNLDKLMKKI